MDRDWSASMLQCILEARRDEAKVLMDAWTREQDPAQLVSKLLAPVMERFGEMWAQSRYETSLAQGYVAARIAEDALELVLKSRQNNQEEKPIEKGPVILGNIEDDYHPLGRKMVLAFLRMEGWKVLDLGLDVPAPTFVEQAVESGARVIGASAMMMSTARNIRNIREELEKRGLSGRIQLAVGGAVFRLRPELVEELGGDGTAETALQAPALFEQLWARSLDSVAKARSAS